MNKNFTNQKQSINSPHKAKKSKRLGKSLTNDGHKKRWQVTTNDDSGENDQSLIKISKGL